MKKIIWLEMVLIGASILIFRSVWWACFDKTDREKGGIG